MVLGVWHQQMWNLFTAAVMQNLTIFSARELSAAWWKAPLSRLLYAHRHTALQQGLITEAVLDIVRADELDFCSQLLNIPKIKATYDYKVVFHFDLAFPYPFRAPSIHRLETLVSLFMRLSLDHSNLEKVMASIIPTAVSKQVFCSTLLCLWRAQILLPLVQLVHGWQLCLEKRVDVMHISQTFQLHGGEHCGCLQV